MAINIKDDETDAKARELAAITGKGITGAISYALDQALGAVKSVESVDQKIAQANKIAEKFQSHLKSNMTSTDHDECLYDEKGLPK